MGRKPSLTYQPAPKRLLESRRQFPALRAEVTEFLAGEDLGETSLMALRLYLKRAIDSQIKTLNILKGQIDTLTDRNSIAVWLGAAKLHEFDPFG
jgi:hypothetical protein